MDSRKKKWVPPALIAGGTAVLYWGLTNFNALQTLLMTLLGLISPFLVGGCIAFVLNVPMRALERLLFRPSKKTGKIRLAFLKRPVCLVLSIVLVVSVICFVILPQFGNILVTLKDAAPSWIAAVQEWGLDLIRKYPEIGQYLQDVNWQSINWQDMLDKAWKFLQEGAGTMFDSTVSIIGSVFSGATAAFLGFIFACYLLAQKERLGNQCKRLLYAYLKQERADGVLRVAALVNRTFSSFITGQCVEAVILGCMFWVTMTIFRFPYASTISVIIAFTALIPVFGALIGMFLGILLILVVDPIQALWFVILFQVLQQLEGNLIYPRVVGSSVGLPGIWVLVAVTVGGSAFGVLGMLFMVPLTSVIYTLVRENSAKRLEKKAVPQEKYQTPVQ